MSKTLFGQNNCPMTETEFKQLIRAHVGARRRDTKAAPEGSFKFLLAYGELFYRVDKFKGWPCIPDYLKSNGRRYPAKDCFAICQDVILHSDIPDLEYYEGFVSGGTGEIKHHAWIVSEGDAVVDLTTKADGSPPHAPSWPLRSGEVVDLSPRPDGRSFFGLGFNREELCMWKAENGLAGRLLVEIG